MSLATANRIADFALHREQLYAAHRRAHRAHFTSEGAWIGPGQRDDVGAAREWLWHAFAFLAGDEADIRLANAILAATPNVANGFNPIAAGHVLLRYGSRVEERARRVLLKIVNDGLGDAIDHSLAVTGVNNFSAMRALLFVAAARLLERYEVSYPHRAIEDVYNRHRLQKFGRNVLLLLEEQLRHTDLAEEFNSPTYTPITLMAVTEVAHFADDPLTLESARRIERRLWQEFLTFFHPLLETPCGPYSRGYEVDRIAHASNAKVLAGMVGLSQLGVEQLLYPPCTGQVIHGGDLVAQQAIACWLAAPDYEIPSDLLVAYHTRTFPFEQTATYRWSGMGYRRSDGRLVLNVEGDYTGPGGQGVAHVWQDRDIAVGSISENYSSQNVPCHIIYKVDDARSGLGTTRAAQLIMRRWQAGQADLSQSNFGAFQLQQRGSVVIGSARPFAWLARSAHISEPLQYRLSLQVSEHLPVGRGVQSVCFNNEPVTIGRELPRSPRGCYRIEDGTARLTWNVRCGSSAMDFKVIRANGVLACEVTLPSEDAMVDFQLDARGA